ncbi:protein translocase subunit secY/sec61 alpha [Granulicatella balaenopterae]|uniref:Protein translocase subunit SecY n=1 Tax=Granulicatella balaenopterae TaxID=137733 RepID=A0A1H9J8T4_9LACT|nr:preprotein translocase subunit SecY [Granulicatella balaenopterae]SEQ83139.1 protein translocase subunit secY/sec61 alpha [Granulicatella balaenopterae]
MFTRMKNAFQEKDVRDRLLFTMMILVVFRIGTHITVPGVNAAAIQAFSNEGLFNILNTFSGGALSSYSIFSMGVSPYITASIVVQLLQMDILPTFVEWSKQGEVGRRKLNQATRYLTIVIGFIQALGVSLGFNALSNFGLITNPSMQTYIMIALVLTTGTMFLTWLGDMITVKGISNGVSILIFAGIIARMPSDIFTFYNQNIAGKSGGDLYRALGFTAALIVAVILVIALVVFVEQAQRRLPIQHSKRATGSNETSRLPLKINSAGVIPVIFASSFMTLPSTVLGFVSATHSEDHWFKVTSMIFDLTQPIGACLFTLLIIIFTYFYAFVQVNPEKVAENLQKQGAYILSVRPGNDTEQYISSLLLRLSTVGAFYLGLIAILPMIASALWSLPRGIMLGGTSLLIVVGVAIEVNRQIEGRTVKRRYQGFIEE